MVAIDVSAWCEIVQPKQLAQLPLHLDVIATVMIVSVVVRLSFSPDLNSNIANQ
jgi:hypothetical protein